MTVNRSSKLEPWPEIHATRKLAFARGASNEKQALERTHVTCSADKLAANCWPGFFQHTIARALRMAGHFSCPGAWLETCSLMSFHVTTVTTGMQVSKPRPDLEPEILLLEHPASLRTKGTTTHKRSKELPQQWAQPPHSLNSRRTRITPRTPNQPAARRRRPIRQAIPLEAVIQLVQPPSACAWRAASGRLGHAKS